MTTEEQRAALKEVLRVNAYLSKAMREGEPQWALAPIREELSRARVVLAAERGLASLPFAVGPAELEALQLHFQNRGISSGT